MLKKLWGKLTLLFPRRQYVVMYRINHSAGPITGHISILVRRSAPFNLDEVIPLITEDDVVVNLLKGEKPNVIITNVCRA